MSPVSSRMLLVVFSSSSANPHTREHHPTSSSTTARSRLVSGRDNFMHKESVSVPVLLVVASNAVNRMLIMYIVAGIMITIALLLLCQIIPSLDIKVVLLRLMISTITMMMMVTRAFFCKYGQKQPSA